MSEMDCNVIRDLMPLCVDGVASEPSQALVNAHVEKCPECAGELQRMREKEQAHAETEVPLSEAWRGFTRAFCRTRALWIVVILLLALGVGLVARSIVLPIVKNIERDVPTETLHVSNVRRTPGGLLLYDMSAAVQDRRRFKGARSELVGDVLYIRYVTGVMSGDRQGLDEQADVWTDDIWDLRVDDNGAVYIDRWWLDDEDGESEKLERKQPVTAVRIGTPKDYISVWEQGDEVPVSRDPEDALYDVGRENG